MNVAQLIAALETVRDAERGHDVVLRVTTAQLHTSGYFNVDSVQSSPTCFRIKTSEDWLCLDGLSWGDDWDGVAEQISGIVGNCSCLPKAPNGGCWSKFTPPAAS